MSKEIKSPHLVLEYVFYPEKREQLYASLGLLFQGLNAEDAGEIFRVLIEYLLSATDISPTEVEEHVRHLPGGVETVKTTAEVLREEGYGLGVEKGKIENTQEMLIETLNERFGTPSLALIRQINAVLSPQLLNILFKQSLKTKSLEHFEEQFKRATRDN